MAASLHACGLEEASNKGSPNRTISHKSHRLEKRPLSELHSTRVSERMSINSEFVYVYKSTGRNTGNGGGSGDLMATELSKNVPVCFPLLCTLYTDP